MGPSEFNEPSTRRLALDSTSSYLFLLNHCRMLAYKITWRNFICQHSAITETTVKQCPLAIICFDPRRESPGFIAIFSGINTRDASYGIPSVFHILTSFVHMTYQLLTVRDNFPDTHRFRTKSEQTMEGTTRSQLLNRKCIICPQT